MRTFSPILPPPRPNVLKWPAASQAAARRICFAKERKNIFRQLWHFAALFIFMQANSQFPLNIVGHGTLNILFLFTPANFSACRSVLLCHGEDNISQYYIFF
jgi:hypothetical protein